MKNYSLAIVVGALALSAGVCLGPVFKPGQSAAQTGPSPSVGAGVALMNVKLDDVLCVASGDAIALYVVSGRADDHTTYRLHQIDFRIHTLEPAARPVMSRWPAPKR